jgi:hypothetical protein
LKENYNFYDETNFRSRKSTFRKINTRKINSDTHFHTPKSKNSITLTNDYLKKITKNKLLPFENGILE